VHTFFNLVAWWINEIVQEFKNENAPGIRNREVFLEYFIKSLVDPVFRCRLELEKLMEGF